MNCPSFQMDRTSKANELAGVQTLADLLHRRARLHGDREVYSFVDPLAGERTLTYAELDARATALAQRLTELADPGDRVVLVYPAGLDFIVAMFGCFAAGMVAVPTYPPHPRRPEPAMPRLTGIMDDARPAVVLSTEALRAAIEPRLTRPPRFLATDEFDFAEASAWTPPDVDPQSLAMLQYTSGSTGTPRGVMLTQANLLANLRLIQQGFGTNNRSSGVFWLPFYHDMGLIGGVLETLYCGGDSLFFSPQTFVQSPIRWLQAITRRRATISGAPNFAYQECVDRITPEQRERLDLSSWKLAFCGAEPIRAQTLRRFAETFAPCGFQAEAFYPCYGLAEATLIVSGGRFVDARSKNPRIENAPVNCGKPLGELSVRVVDPHTERAVYPGETGEIWIAGPSVAQGYFNRPEESQATFGAHLSDTGEGPFLRSGDLGYLSGGGLVVTGRAKDMIIVGGRNHYPVDIEQTVERCHPAVLAGGCAAFEVEIDGLPRIVVAVEIDRQSFRELRGQQATGAAGDLQQVIQAIRRSVATGHDVEVHAAVLVKARSLPRTTSGKLQRYACRVAYLAGQLDSVPTDGE